MHKATRLSLLAAFVMAIASTTAACGDNIMPPSDGDTGTNPPGDLPPIVVETPPDMNPPDTTPPGDGGPACTDVPEAPPTITFDALPSDVLHDGLTVAYRLTVLAPSQADVQLKKLSFAIDVDAADQSVHVASPRLRETGTGTDLDADADSRGTDPVHCGESGGTSCFRIVLVEPFVVPAGTSRTLDLRLSIGGNLAVGDMVTTGLYRDAEGPHQGGLTGTGLDTVIDDGVEDGDLWSNGGCTWYNGHDIAGTPVAATMTR